MAAPPDRRSSDALRPPGAKLRVLFLGATPSDTARIAVGEEYRHVDASVRASDHAGRFEFHFAHEVRAGELGPALLRHRPHIVHFSGHGSAGGELLLPDASGQAAPAKPERLARLFEVVGRELSIRCVVLNACYSEALAKALAAQVDCVIGVPTALKDRVAVTFAGALYQAIGFGYDLDAAYRYACAQVELALPTRGALPTLHCREGVRASEIRFLPSTRSTLIRASAPRPSTVAREHGPPERRGPWARGVLVAGVAAGVAAVVVAATLRWLARPTAAPSALDAGSVSAPGGGVRASWDASAAPADASPEPAVSGVILLHGRPLSGARVSVLGSDCAATTDARGAFELRCGALPRHAEATVLVEGRPSEPFRLHGGARYGVDRHGRVTTRRAPTQDEPRPPEPVVAPAEAARPDVHEAPRRDCSALDPSCADITR